MNNERTCGKCTLCCELLEIKELHKPKNQRCRYQRLGCDIYDCRPIACRQFSCLWLTDYKIPPFMRPDKSGMVLHALPSLGDRTLIVHQKNARSIAKRYVAGLKLEIIYR